MKAINQGANTLYFNTSEFSTEEVTVDIYSTMTLETKTSTFKLDTYNDRYFTIKLTIVDREEEDLSANKFYLDKGEHIITLKQGKESILIYTDILILGFTPVDKTRQYDNTDKKIRVYNGE